jgi:hypothetical protein
MAAVSDTVKTTQKTARIVAVVSGVHVENHAGSDYRLSSVAPGAGELALGSPDGDLGT